jgi:ribonucleoside-diphosphate reductase alpha chain
MTETTTLEVTRRVIKRDGRLVKFDKSKIHDAIMKAMQVVSEVNEGVANSVTDLVVADIGDKSEIPVEDIQDLVENALIKLASPKVIKEYILYRVQRKDVRDFKAGLGVDDSLKLSANAISLLDGRYLKMIEGKKETPSQMFRRTARHVAAVEKRYGEDPGKWAKTFYNLMANQIFYPNMPCISNSGVPGLNYLMSCYVLSVGDSMEEIFTVAKDAAMIMKSGGGIGLNFSELRPKNDLVKSTGKVSSGVVGFLPVYDAVVESVKQGGMRRGAALGLLRIDHPDILEFINCKKEEGKLSNFNLSVAITDKFMSAVARDAEVPLINPRTGKSTESIRARYLLNLIAKNAWEKGDPGIVFFDKCNKNNPTPTLGPTYKNACGETDLLPYEGCCLGSINLTKFVTEDTISWGALAKTIFNAVHFLDDVIDATDYILPKVKEICQANRKIGLGLMGFADVLYMLKIPYNSDEAVKLADKIMDFIYIKAREVSEKLAQERGAFPNFGISIYDKPVRNASFTVLAPTGEISLLANCSPGIEPNYGLVFKRQTTLAVHELVSVNPVFEAVAKKEGFFSPALLDKIIQNGGRVHGLKEVPEEWQKVFVTALEVSPTYHIRIQAAFQKHLDNSVSKTINMPFSSTVEDVERAIKEAYDLGCNGVTIFRDGCRDVQVMSVGENDCPECKIPLIFSEGCFHCPSCGWGKCVVG